MHRTKHQTANNQDKDKNYTFSVKGMLYKEYISQAFPKNKKLQRIK